MNQDLSKIYLEGEVPAQKPSPKAKKKRAASRTCQKPADGYAWNPIFQHMKRNDLCLCDSGHKWKKCCMSKQPRVVSQNVADHMAVRIATMKSKLDR